MIISRVAQRLGLGELPLQVFCTEGSNELRVPVRWFAGVEVPVGDGFGTIIVRESLFSYRTQAALEEAMCSGFFPIDNDPFTEGEGRRPIFKAER